MHTEGPGIWRKLKITENEKYTLFQGRKYGEEN